MKHRSEWLCALGIAMTVAALGLVGACAQPECTRPDYTQAECRVLAENELARLRTGSGIELRFQPPQAEHADSWDALGVLADHGPGRVRARAAAPGPLAISMERPIGAPAQLRLSLQNVDPQVALQLVTDAETIDLGRPMQPRTTRELDLLLPEGQTSWIRGELACPPRFRVAVLGDIQTNPFQFERVMEQLQIEASEAPLDEPLLALLLLGDLTELSNDNEFERIAEILERSPVPVAATPGNHDVFASSRASYNHAFGPGNYAFDLCGTRFAMLDTGNGGLAPSVEGRLTELLGDEDEPGREHLIVATHYPAYPGLTGSGWSREDQAQHLLVEAAFADTDLLLAGHIHGLMDFPDIPVAGKRLRQVVAGTGGADQGLGRARYGYLRLTIAKDEVATCFREVRPPGSASDNNPFSKRLPNCER